MKRKIFIHIGTHKTGSTSIKSALRQSKKVLKKHKLRYIETHWSYEIMRDEEVDFQKLKTIRDSFQNEVSKIKSTERVVISAEKFSGNPYSGYQNAGVLASYLKFITEGLEAEVLVYVRRQDSFLESLYTQSIQQGEQHSFQSFLQSSNPNLFDWNLFVKEFENHFGNNKVKVRSYEYLRGMGKNELLEDYFKTLGINSLNEIILDSRPSNVSYSRVALDFASRANSHINAKNQKAFRRGLQFSNSTNEPKQFFTSTERINVLKSLNAANLELAKRKLSINERKCLCDIPDEVLLKSGAPTLDRMQVLEEVLAKYIAYNESKASAEPKDILRSIYHLLWRKNG